MLFITRGIIEGFVIFFIFPRSFVEGRDKWFDRSLHNVKQHASQNLHILIKGFLFFMIEFREMATCHLIIITLVYSLLKSGGEYKKIFIIPYITNHYILNTLGLTKQNIFDIRFGDIWFEIVMIFPGYLNTLRNKV